MQDASVVLRTHVALHNAAPHERSPPSQVLVHAAGGYVDDERDWARDGARVASQWAHARIDHDVWCTRRQRVVCVTTHPASVAADSANELRTCHTALQRYRRAYAATCPRTRIAPVYNNDATGGIDARATTRNVPATAAGAQRARNAALRRRFESLECVTWHVRRAERFWAHMRNVALRGALVWTPVGASPRDVHSWWLWMPFPPIIADTNDTNDTTDATRTNADRGGGDDDDVPTLLVCGLEALLYADTQRRARIVLQSLQWLDTERVGVAVPFADALRNRVLGTMLNHADPFWHRLPLGAWNATRSALVLGGNHSDRYRPTRGAGGGGAASAAAVADDEISSEDDDDDNGNAATTRAVPVHFCTLARPCDVCTSEQAPRAGAAPPQQSDADDKSTDAALFALWFGDGTKRATCPVCDEAEVRADPRTYHSAHVWARARGGLNGALWNRVPTCMACNLRMAQRNLLWFAWYDAKLDVATRRARVGALITRLLDVYAAQESNAQLPARVDDAVRAVYGARVDGGSAEDGGARGARFWRFCTSLGERRVAQNAAS